MTRKNAQYEEKVKKNGNKQTERNFKGHKSHNSYYKTLNNKKQLHIEKKNLK